MRPRPVLVILSVASVLALAHPAAAQNPAAPAAPKSAAPAPAKAAPAPAPVSPASAAAAAELFRTLKLQSGLQDTTAAIVDSEISRNPGLTPYRDVMLQWLRKYMTWDAMAPELTRMYTQAFTDAELKDMNAFYKTATGQKALERLPLLMQQSAMVGARLGQPHTDELKAAMNARSEQLKKEQEKAQAASGTPSPGKAPGKAPAAKPTAAPSKP